MGLVMLLVGGLYVTVMAALIAYGFSTLSVIVIAVALGLGQWFFSDKLAMTAMRAREVTPNEAPELHGMVDRLVALADMPKPRVAIAYTDVPNAFATGRSPHHSVIAVTTGLLDRLDGEELEGVLSHELSHVAHRDVLVMTFAGFLGVAAGLVMRWGMFLGGGRRDGNSVPFLVIWLGSIVVYFVSFLLTRVLSRIPTKDLREAQAFNSFFFAPAVKGEQVASLFATHPPLERRLAQLAEISADLSRPA
jgi:heat shock protein HtpX